jgi:hypothetical protein
MMEFNVYSRRWGHFDTYKLNKTPGGWYIKHLDISGNCDTYGNPIFYQIFERDCISYPSNFSEYLYYLWQKVDSNKWNERTIQPKLNALAKWVSHTEYYKPKRGIFAELSISYQE